MMGSSWPLAGQGSTLLQLANELADLRVPAGAPALADRLSHWLSWTDAIALASALQEPAQAAGCPAVETFQDELRRLRDVHAVPLTEVPRGVTPSRALPPGKQQPEQIDWPTFKRRYQARQQAMETAIVALRERMRTAVRQRGMTRLAAVDAVMERVLGDQERPRLGLIPSWVERRHRRDPVTAADTVSDSALQEIDAFLQAELDHRLQPLEGLLAALHPQPR